MRLFIVISKCPYFPEFSLQLLTYLIAHQKLHDCFMRPEVQGMLSDAIEQGFEVNIGKFNVQANGKALAMGETEGMIKLVVDAKYGELLGGHMIGPEVTELLGELALTKLLEGTSTEVGWAVHPHPTISEMLKEAALDAQGKALHM